MHKKVPRAWAKIMKRIIVVLLVFISFSSVFAQGTHRIESYSTQGKYYDWKDNIYGYNSTNRDIEYTIEYRICKIKFIANPNNHLSEENCSQTISVKCVIPKNSSHVKLLDDRDIHYYPPYSVGKACIDWGIEIIDYTYKFLD